MSSATDSHSSKSVDAWRVTEPALDLQPPESLQALAAANPARHPLQLPTLWGLRKGAVLPGVAGDGSWVFGLSKRWGFRPLLKGPWYRLPVFIPVGNSVAGMAADSAAEPVILQLLESLPQVPAAAILFDEIDTVAPLAVAALELASAGKITAAWSDLPQQSWLLHFPEDRSSYWGQFSSKRRSKMRREASKLTGPIEIYTAPEQAAEFVRNATKVSERSWQHQSLGPRINVTPLQMVVQERLAQAGLMHNAILWHESEPVAFFRGYIVGDMLYYDEGGFDQAVAGLSPGSVLLVGLFEKLITDDMAIKGVDFGFGDADYKSFFGNAQVERGHLIVAPRNARLATALGIHRSVLSVARRAKRLIKEHR